jgi:hypothetical protein
VTRAALAILGAYLCLLGAVVHRQIWHVSEVTVPWGVVSALGVTGVVALAANRVISIGSAWVALGWASGLLLLQWSPGGGYLIASDLLGLVFTGGGLGVIVAAIAVRPKVKQ